MTEETIYKTTFVNDRESHVPVLTYEGNILVVVPPLESVYIESFSTATDFARWKEVRFLKDGSVRALENKDWSDPYTGWAVECINETKAVKSVRIDGIYCRVFPGIPRSIPIPLHDPLIYIKTIRWTHETCKIPDIQHQDYLVEETKDVKKFEERGVREIQKIKSLLKDDASKKADKMIANRSPRLESGEEDQDSSLPIFPTKE